MLANKIGSKSLGPMTVHEAERNAFEQVQARSSSVLSFEELYRTAYNLTMHKHGLIVYNGFQCFLAEYLSRSARAMESIKVDQDFLSAVCRHWSDYKAATKVYCDILLYMDRTYLQQTGRPGVNETCLRLYQEKLIQGTPVFLSRLTVCVLNNMDEVRMAHSSNCAVDLDLTHAFIDMTLSTDACSKEKLFDNWVFPKYLESCEKYYLKISLCLMGMKSEQFVTLAIDAFQFEPTLLGKEALVQKGSQSDALTKSLVVAWILPHFEAVIEMNLSTPLTDGLSETIVHTNREKLYSLYTLFKKDSASYDHLLHSWLVVVEKYISSITDIGQLMDALELVQRTITDCFQKDSAFVFQSSAVIERIVNEEKMDLSKKLALYFDDTIKKTLKQAIGDTNSSDFSEYLKKAIQVFKLVNGKDVFESHHRWYLGKRLLASASSGSISASLMEPELAVLNKLKSECGPGYTFKMESMIQDWTSHSKMSLNLQKAKSESSQPVLSFPISVKVLTTSVWPTGLCGSVTPKWDLLMKQQINLFTKQYVSQFPGRKLAWSALAGSVEMVANSIDSPTGSEVTLTVSPIQAMVLLLFNNLECATNGISLNRISHILGVEMSDLKRHVLPLLIKCKLLRTERQLEEVNEDEPIFLNSSFSPNARHVHVPVIANPLNNPMLYDMMSHENKYDTPGMEPSVPQSVLDDRKHAVEAGIVRAMKARRKLDHGALCQIVAESLKNRFNPSEHLLQNRIDNLIEREFIKCDIEDNSKIYLYVA